HFGAGPESDRLADRLRQRILREGRLDHLIRGRVTYRQQAARRNRGHQVRDQPVRVVFGRYTVQDGDEQDAYRLGEVEYVRRLAQERRGVPGVRVDVH